MTDHLAHQGAHRHSSDLVPYSAESQQIILRHNNTIVVYDARSKQLTASQLPLPEANECPYCHRPFPSASTETVDGNYGDDEESNYITPHYFRRLAASRAGSSRSSRPTSPRRRLVHTDHAGVPNGSTSGNGSPTRISAEAFSQGYFARFFTVERELGRGGKGVVLLVKHSLDNVDLGRFACKRVPCGDNHDWLHSTLMEVSLLQELSHPNLVSYLHCWIEDFQSTRFGPSTPHVFILQQYCNGGTLLQHILGPKSDPSAPGVSLQERARRFSATRERRPTRRLAFDEIFSFFHDITSGLAYLHANGYVHRDLKPQNCLLHRSNDKLRVLVSDFGEMQALDTVRRPGATGYTGTVSFAAPEVVRRDNEGNLGNFTVKSDIFSLGMIVFFMCFGHLPYQYADLEEEDHEDLTKLREEILAWTGLQDERRERTDLPEKLFVNLQLLLSHDPDERPTTDEILRLIKSGAEQHSASPTKDRFSPDFTEHSWASENDTGAALRARRSSIPRRQSRLAGGLDSAVTPARSNSRPTSSEAGLDDPKRQPRPSRDVTPRRHVPLLMPPPPPASYHPLNWHWYRTLFQSPRATSVFSIVLFLSKVWSLLSVCGAFAPQPGIVYPLLGIAALDLAWNVGMWGSLALLVVHLSVVWGAVAADQLCVRNQLFDPD